MLGAFVLALAVGEIFFFPRSGPYFASRLGVRPFEPSASLLALLDTLPDGPVLDFPPSRFVSVATHYVLLHGFHDRPTDACHSSFPSPMREEVMEMSARLPNSITALKLRTLGFRATVVHKEFLGPERLARFQQWVEGDGRKGAGLRLIGEADGHLAYAFGPAPPTVGLDALTLAPAVLWHHTQTLATPGQAVKFVVANSSWQFYRHPDPIRLNVVVLAWLDEQGAVRASERLSLLLPIALLPGGKQIIPVPPPSRAGATGSTRCSAGLPSARSLNASGVAAVIYRNRSSERAQPGTQRKCLKTMVAELVGEMRALPIRPEILRKWLRTSAMSGKRHG